MHSGVLQLVTTVSSPFARRRREGRGAAAGGGDCRGAQAGVRWWGSGGRWGGGERWRRGKERKRRGALAEGSGKECRRRGALAQESAGGGERRGALVRRAAEEGVEGRWIGGDGGAGGQRPAEEGEGPEEQPISGRAADEEGERRRRGVAGREWRGALAEESAGEGERKEHRWRGALAKGSARNTGGGEHWRRDVEGSAGERWRRVCWWRGAAEEEGMERRGGGGA
ncbi:hypothetical protein CBR_g39365 [Chara braunii]|uniref:Uncharacterized protein n=1 Tax=Chara braunii TaxID=69332 RepID=A0A388LRF8_CHABU|nr:hypothetical protein CBR_g39365 [Chara braunii]|eukprot:GBG84904.1 hypothetical protein CBR_g39365 [Chara braunii]